METKPALYVMTLLIIVTILSSAYLSSIKIGDLENTINEQNNKIASYNQLLSDQATQLQNFSQRLDLQQSIIEQYNQTTNQQNNQTTNQNTQQNETFSVTVVDDSGYLINITTLPKRIVSLAPSNTELLFAVGAGDQVVGITNYCDYPYNFSAWVNAGNMSSIGSYWHPSIEPIISLDPDLILASGSSSEAAADQLRNLGYTVLNIDATTVNDVLDDVYLVGQATGHSEEAASLVNSLRSRIDAVKNTVADAETTPTVYIEVSNDPLMAVGPNTFLNDLVNLAKGKNIFDDVATKYPTVSSDVIITKNPDVILSPFPDVTTRPGWSTINAVANSQIYNQGSDSMYVRAGPRLIDALEELAQILHPELFGSS
ncbi:MAG: ABC transporter substrate-binding protein [Candidatus Bathyarchaeia archaeon]|jgi:iron complex transport system substrate-binding protein